MGWLSDSETVKALRPMGRESGAQGDVVLESGDDIMKLQDPAYREAWQRNGYVLFDPQKVEQIDLGRIGAEGAEPADVAELIATYGREGTAEGKAFWIPKPFADELMETERLFKDQTFVKTFVQNLSSVQGVWKMYALMSPGYHFRNLYSNIFQNMIAGVNNPKRYMEAMAVQAGGSDKLPIGVRHAVEAVMGRKTADDVLFTDP